MNQPAKHRLSKVFNSLNSHSVSYDTLNLLPLQPFHPPWQLLVVELQVYSSLIHFAVAALCAIAELGNIFIA